MVGTLLTSPQTSIKKFLKEAATGNSLKYRAEKNTEHRIFVPSIEFEVTDSATGAVVTEKGPSAFKIDVHEFTDSEGHFKSFPCLKMTGAAECPFCNRVGDAISIYKFRKSQEEARCQLTGDDREKHLKNTFATYREEMKMKPASPKLYLLVAQYKLDNGNPVLDKTGTPEFDLKIMRLAPSTLEKINTQLEAMGLDMLDNELKFIYGNDENPGALVVHRSVVPVIQAKFIDTYPGLKEKINAQVKAFDWNQITSSFPEAKEIEANSAKEMMDGTFKAWDQYQKELSVNPAAVYAEYSVKTNMPEVGGNLGAFGAPNVPHVPTIPQVGDMNLGQGAPAAAANPFGTPASAGAPTGATMSMPGAQAPADGAMPFNQGTPAGAADVFGGTPASGMPFDGGIKI